MGTGNHDHYCLFGYTSRDKVAGIHTKKYQQRVSLVAFDPSTSGLHDQKHLAKADHDRGQPITTKKF